MNQQKFPIIVNRKSGKKLNLCSEPVECSRIEFRTKAGKYCFVIVSKFVYMFPDIIAQKRRCRETDENFKPYL
uniref:Uncharacterized protein n=1 Tax=Romanomermis culicivorax TaxID=13658 RepID=A0A915K2N5_ROMCU